MTNSDWVSSIDAVFVINLLKRGDRRKQVKQELDECRIPFLFYNAIENENGAEGLRQTMRYLFVDCLDAGLKRVLIFEDDAIMIEDINKYMPLCLEQLPENFDLFYLGCQPLTTIENFYSPNLIPVHAALATHAILWSEAGMNKFLQSNAAPIDMSIKSNIQPDGKCFMSYPMLVSQRPSHSDIDGQVRDWGFCLQDRYNRLVKEYLNRC